MALSNPLARFVRHIAARVRARPDSEFQQSLIRLAIGVVFFAYFSSPALALSEASRHTALITLVLFFSVSLAITDRKSVV